MCIDDIFGAQARSKRLPGDVYGCSFWPKALACPRDIDLRPSDIVLTSIDIDATSIVIAKTSIDIDVTSIVIDMTSMKMGLERSDIVLQQLVDAVMAGIKPKRRQFERDLLLRKRLDRHEGHGQQLLTEQWPKDLPTPVNTGSKGLAQRAAAPDPAATRVLSSASTLSSVMMSVSAPYPRPHPPPRAPTGPLRRCHRRRHRGSARRRRPMYMYEAYANALTPPIPPEQPMSSSTDTAAVLQRLGIVRFTRDMRTLSRDELAAAFASQRSGRIILTRLIRSIIWQVLEWIRSGELTPRSGNLRTFWYRHVKPVLAHIPDDDEAKTDPYETMLAAFTELVMEEKLCRYAEFDFTDENWEHRRIGTRTPHILLFAEKRGWMRFLKRAHERWGISVLSLGGAPSALTSEYTAAHLQPVLEPDTQIRLVGIVDFDPSGWVIAQAFQDQLAQTGLTQTQLHTLIHPRHYSPEELAMFRYPLPRGQTTLTERWLAQTGGIEGEKWGLEAESMPRDKVISLIEHHIQAHA